MAFHGVPPEGRSSILTLDTLATESTRAIRLGVVCSKKLETCEFLGFKPHQLIDMQSRDSAEKIYIYIYIILYIYSIYILYILYIIYIHYIIYTVYIYYIIYTYIIYIQYIYILYYIYIYYILYIILYILCMHCMQQNVSCTQFLWSCKPTQLRNWGFTRWENMVNAGVSPQKRGFLVVKTRPMWFMQVTCVAM